jgi:hypothetical protein
MDSRVLRPRLSNFVTSTTSRARCLIKKISLIGAEKLCGATEDLEVPRLIELLSLIRREPDSH